PVLDLVSPKLVEYLGMFTPARSPYPNPPCAKAPNEPNKIAADNNSFFMFPTLIYFVLLSFTLIYFLYENYYSDICNIYSKMHKLFIFTSKQKKKLMPYFFRMSSKRYSSLLKLALIQP